MISENRTMRKIYIGMIILCMFLGLSSCKTNSDTESDAAKQSGNKTISDVEEAKSHNLSYKEKVEGDDTAVHPEPEIIDLKECY